MGENNVHRHLQQGMDGKHFQTCKFVDFVSGSG